MAMGVGTARAKLLLLGEHAAVHGHVAVGLTLPWTLTVTHTPGERWNAEAWGEFADPVRRLVYRLGELAAERGLTPPQPGTLEATSDIVPSGGFGSSAALCAALVNAFYPDLIPSAKDELAWRAEFLFHGTPSGIDTALAFREGWWALEPGTPGVTPARPRPLPDPHVYLVVGSVVRQADTKTLVASVTRRLQDGDPAVRESIARLGALAQGAAERLENGDSALAPFINEARSHLRTLDLETPALTVAIDAGLACPGALAGKLSGAGGGGAFFVMFDSSEAAQASLEPIKAAVPAERWKTLPTLVP
jgi:mevalonate kinase